MRPLPRPAQVFLNSKYNNMKSIRIMGTNLLNKIFASLALLLTLNGCIFEAGGSAPACADGTNCILDLSLDMTGISPQDQKMRISINAVDAQSSTTQGLMLTAPNPMQSFNCITSLCAVHLTSADFPLGAYRVTATNEQGDFLGTGALFLEGTKDGIMVKSVILDMETTGYYVASLLTRGLSAIDGSVLLDKLNELTGANSDQGQEMAALGKYFLQQGGGDPARHPELVSALLQSIDRSQAPYQDGAPLESGAGAVVGKLSLEMLKEFVRGDEFKNDPAGATLHLLKFSVGMTTDIKKILQSGGETRNALKEIKKGLDNSFAAITGMAKLVSDLKAQISDQHARLDVNNLELEMANISQVYSNLQSIDSSAHGCIKDGTKRLASNAQSLNDYVDLFVSKPDKNLIYDKDCLENVLKGIFTQQTMNDLRKSMIQISGDGLTYSLLYSTRVSLKNKYVLYPNKTFLGTDQARLERPLSESYDIYNKLITKYATEAELALVKYADIYETLLHIRSRFPEFVLYDSEGLARDELEFEGPAFAGANECHDASGTYFRDRIASDNVLAKRCRLEMMMAKRAKMVADLSRPLSFTNDADLLSYLPEGEWRTFCKFDKRNLPNGPVVLDFDGVNLWTICSADSKLENVPSAPFKYADPVGGSVFTYYSQQARSMDCSAFSQPKDYAEKIWPKAYGSFSKDTGKVAIACSDRNGQANFAVSHVNLSHCGLEGGAPAKIGVIDGILECQTSYSDSSYWNKYKLRLNDGDTNGVRFDRLSVDSRGYSGEFGILGFPRGTSREMFTKSNTRSSIVERQGTLFGRRLDGGSRSILDNGTALVFNLKDVKVSDYEKIGDLLVNEMRYNTIISVPTSSTILASLTRLTEDDLIKFKIRDKSDPTVPLLVYRRFAMGFGERNNYFLWRTSDTSHSAYLRCPADDSGCSTYTTGQNDKFLVDESDSDHGVFGIEFKNATWGKLALQKLGGGLTDADKLIGETVNGHAITYSSSFVYLTVRP